MSGDDAGMTSLRRLGQGELKPIGEGHADTIVGGPASDARGAEAIDGHCHVNFSSAVGEYLWA